MEKRMQPEEESLVALVDGGATHALRRGTPEELQRADPVTVELACGTTTLYRKKGSGTLLSDQEVEPIVPVRLLVEHGYRLTWGPDECNIEHPTKGKIRCWRRSGCPVMNREEALDLIEELEDQSDENLLTEETKSWWKERYPNLPEEVLQFMKGQHMRWQDCPGILPFNRRQRKL